MCNESKSKKNSNESIVIPITILTGFLGSGKTTLLNHIIKNQQGIKTAVLVNEFGEVGIDNELIVTTSENMIELTNGCICCSINGDLLKAVEKLLSEKESIDYIIIETTGLADPLPVAMTFLGSELRDKTRLDSIITLVDADNFNQDLLESDIAKSQIIYGDILLLNKCDLVNDQKILEIENQLNILKKDARILKSCKAEIPIPLLLSVGLFESDKIEKVKINDNKNCDHQHGIGHHDHTHEDSLSKNEIEDYTSVSFQSSQPFSLRKFQNFLDNQLPSQVFRAKGILWFNESDKRYIFHLAGKRFSIDDSEWKDTRKNQLVFIGKDLEHEKLKSQILACIN